MCDNEPVPGPDPSRLDPDVDATSQDTHARDAGGGGGGGTTPELFGAVYEQLRDLAHKRMTQERSDLTLQTTALVHEVYLRLMKNPEVTWENPRHFFGAAAESMRRILIERARRYAAHKHGGGRSGSISPSPMPRGERVSISMRTANPRRRCWNSTTP